MTDRPLILLAHGPNLNLLGERKPEVYGTITLAQIESVVVGEAGKLGLEVECFQSNSEGALIDFLHERRKRANGVILNVGAYTHTSVALRDAIEAIRLPVVEVHISNTHAREPFRHTSLLAGVCIGTIAGLGVAGYRAAVSLLAQRLNAGESTPPGP